MFLFSPMRECPYGWQSVILDPLGMQTLTEVGQNDEKKKTYAVLVCVCLSAPLCFSRVKRFTMFEILRLPLLIWQYLDAMTIFSLRCHNINQATTNALTI